jgi:serine protease Do
VVPALSPGLPHWVYGTLAGAAGALVLLVGLVVVLLFRSTRVQPEPAALIPSAAMAGFVEAASPVDSVARTSAPPSRLEESQPGQDLGTTPPPPPTPDTRTPGGAILSTAEIVARCEPSVALIKGRMSSGTGFLIRPGIVATNAHVINDEMVAGLEIRFPSAPDGKTGPHPAELLYEDARRDLAFLAVKTDLPPLNVAQQFRYRKGEDVTVIGNPGVGGEMVLENAVSRGVLSVRTRIDGQDFVQLGIAINPGNSGGPVFDTHGQVIGVATLKTKEEEALAFCIPVEDLRAALDRLAHQSPQAAADAASKHRVPVVFKRLTEAGAIHAVGLDLRLAAWERAPGQPLDLNNPALADLRTKLADLDKIDTIIFSPVPDEAQRVADDQRASDDVRREIGRLAANYAELKRLSEHPGNSLTTFRTEVTERKEAHLRLVKTTAAMLKLTVPPILALALPEHSQNDPVALMERASPAASRPGLPSFRDRYGLGGRPSIGSRSIPRINPPHLSGHRSTLPRYRGSRSRFGRR